MTLTQLSKMTAAEPFMAVGAIVGVVAFFATASMVFGEWGMGWAWALVILPFFVFWLVTCNTESVSGDSMRALKWGLLAMVPFLILWLYKLIPLWLRCSSCGS